MLAICSNVKVSVVICYAWGRRPTVTELASLTKHFHENVLTPIFTRPRESLTNLRIWTFWGVEIWHSAFRGVPKDTFETFFLFRSVSEVSNYKAVNRPPQPLPGVGVNNPTNKPDLAYCALILTMILLKQHRTSPARHLPCYAATQFDQKIVNKYFPPNVFAKVKVHALRDCGWQIGFD